MLAQEVSTTDDAASTKLTTDGADLEEMPVNITLVKA
jgi:hypothetical protein